MKKWLLVLMILISTTATAGKPNWGKPLETECVVPTEAISIQFHLYQTEKELSEAYVELGKKYGFIKRGRSTSIASRRTIRRGFALYSKTTDTHHVHLVKFRGQKDTEYLETWGHEIAHVLCGAWHVE